MSALFRIMSDQVRNPYLEERLYFASCDGDLVTFTSLCQRGVRPDGYLDSDTSDSRTGLHEACRNGHTSVVLVLIEYSADINKKDSQDYTPLIIACEHGKEDVVKILMENRADVNATNYLSESALHYASDRLSVTTVQRLLNARAIVDQPDNKRLTPLFDATRACKQDIVRLLLEHQADPSFHNILGENAREYGIRQNDSGDRFLPTLEVLNEFQALLKCGRDVCTDTLLLAFIRKLWYRRQLK